MSTVLILANSSAGLYDFRNDLVKALLEKHRVVVSLPDTVKTDLLAAEGCEVVHTEINRRGINPKQDLGLVLSYRKLFREVKPDLVLTYTIKPNIYGGFLCRLMGIPYITTITGLGSAFQKTGVFLQLIRTLYRAGLKKAACVFFQNGENERLFTETGLLSGKHRLVAGSGVNLSDFKPQPYPKDGKCEFLFVGRVMREKGIAELIEAARELHSESVVFSLIGYCDEDWQEELDALEKEGVIVQKGFHTDMEAQYGLCSAVCMPTWHEGMSNVLMEAAACARPCIASDIPGCREIFEEGKTGFGFEAKNADSLKEALRRFIALSPEQREQMGYAARKRMEEHFDRKKVTGAYLEEIENCLHKKD